MAEFVEAFAIQGFDPDATPRFQMVPTGGARIVALRDGGTGAFVDTLNPAVCKVSEVKGSALTLYDHRLPSGPGDRFFKLEGASAGFTHLVAFGGSIHTPLKLEVGVKDRRKQVVAFNFLHDNAGHGTGRPEASVAERMETAKYFWRRQANIELVDHGMRRITITEDLGDPILLPLGNIGTTGETIAAAGLRGVDLNVFFVWRLQEVGNPDDVDAVTTNDTANSPGPGTCIFEDRAGKGQGLTLAHEIGHHLGLDHPGHRRGIHLMWGGTDERGPKLTKDDINTANRSGAIS